MSVNRDQDSIRSITSGRSLTVFLEGDIDHHSARRIRTRIDTKVFIQRPDELILGRYAKAVEMGIAFKVANPNRDVRRILDLAGTERLIKIENAYPAGARGEALCRKP